MEELTVENEGNAASVEVLEQIISRIKSIPSILKEETDATEADGEQLRRNPTAHNLREDFLSTEKKLQTVSDQISAICKNLGEIHAKLASESEIDDSDNDYHDDGTEDVNERNDLTEKCGNDLAEENYLLHEEIIQLRSTVEELKEQLRIEKLFKLDLQLEKALLQNQLGKREKIIEALKRRIENLADKSRNARSTLKGTISDIKNSPLCMDPVERKKSSYSMESLLSYWDVARD